MAKEANRKEHVGFTRMIWNPIKRVFQNFIGVLILLVALLYIGIWGISQTAGTRSIMQDQLKKDLGIPVTIEKMSTDWKLNPILDKVVIKSAESDVQQIGHTIEIEKLYLTWRLTSIFKRPRFTQVKAVNPQLVINVLSHHPDTQDLLDSVPLPKKERVSEVDVSRWLARVCTALCGRVDSKKYKGERDIKHVPYRLEVVNGSVRWVRGFYNDFASFYEIQLVVNPVRGEGELNNSYSFEARRAHGINQLHGGPIATTFKHLDDGLLIFPDNRQEHFVRSADTPQERIDTLPQIYSSSYTQLQEEQERARLAAAQANANAQGYPANQAYMDNGTSTMPYDPNRPYPPSQPSYSSSQTGHSSSQTGSSAPYGQQQLYIPAPGLPTVVEAVPVYPPAVENAPRASSSRAPDPSQFVIGEPERIRPIDSPAAVQRPRTVEAPEAPRVRKQEVVVDAPRIRKPEPLAPPRIRKELVTTPEPKRKRVAIVTPEPKRSRVKEAPPAPRPRKPTAAELARKVQPTAPRKDVYRPPQPVYRAQAPQIVPVKRQMTPDDIYNMMLQAERERR